MAAKTGTYSLIGSANGTGSANQITFSSIPSTYTDLILVVNGRQTGAVTYSYAILTVNGDTSGTSYSRTYIKGNGTTASSSRDSNYAQLYTLDNVPGASATSGEHNSAIINIFDYSNTSTYKTFLMRDGQAGNTVTAGVGLWRSTQAISSITISAFTGNWTTTSNIKLYGIEAGNA